MSGFNHDANAALQIAGRLEAEQGNLIKLMQGIQAETQDLMMNYLGATAKSYEASNGRWVEGQNIMNEALGTMCALLRDNTKSYLVGDEDGAAIFRH